MGTEGALDLLHRGREPLAAADWATARSCFEQARERDATPEALDGLSEVAHFEGEYDRAIELKERAFAAYRSGDKRVEAADVARWLAFLHVATRSTVSGRHEGELMGAQPTGREVAFTCLTISRCRGRIEEEWELADVVSLLRQLGGASADGPSLTSDDRPPAPPPAPQGSSGRSGWASV